MKARYKVVNVRGMETFDSFSSLKLALMVAKFIVGWKRQQDSVYLIMTGIEGSLPTMIAVVDSGGVTMLHGKAIRLLEIRYKNTRGDVDIMPALVPGLYSIFVRLAEHRNRVIGVKAHEDLTDKLNTPFSV